MATPNLTRVPLEAPTRLRIVVGRKTGAGPLVVQAEAHALEAARLYDSLAADARKAGDIAQAETCEATAAHLRDQVAARRSAA